MAENVIATSPDGTVSAYEHDSSRLFAYPFSVWNLPPQTLDINNVVITLVPFAVHQPVALFLLPLLDLVR